MTAKKATLLKKFFADKDGQIVTWQSPNALLCIWVIIKLLSAMLSDSEFRGGLVMLASAVLFCWAYLEFTQGVTYFRRFLGAAVLAVTILGFF